MCRVGETDTHVRPDTHFCSMVQTTRDVTFPRGRMPRGETSACDVRNFQRKSGGNLPLGVVVVTEALVREKRASTQRGTGGHDVICLT